MRTLAAATFAAVVAATAGTACSGKRSTGEDRGREIFTRSCAACHTLTGHERGTGGGDLVNADLAVADLVSFARTMPVRPPLTDAEALAVATYVHAVTTGKRAKLGGS